MFTKNQTLNINGYFNMINDKLFELYKQINKDDFNKDLHIDFDGVAKACFSFDDDYMSFSYSLTDSDMGVKFDNSSNSKGIYFDEDLGLSVFYDSDNNICDFSINSEEVMTEEEFLEKFNVSIAQCKIALQNVIDLLSVHCDVEGVLIDDFIMPGFVFNGKPEIEQNKVITVLAAAIKIKGIITLGYSHADCMNRLGMQQYTIDVTSDVDGFNDYPERGYITSDGRFIYSNDVWVLAKKNGLFEDNAQCFRGDSEAFYKSCGKYYDLMEARNRISTRLKNHSKNRQKLKKEM